MDQEFPLLCFMKGVTKGTHRETRTTLLDRRAANTQHIFIPWVDVVERCEGDCASART